MYLSFIFLIIQNSIKYCIIIQLTIFIFIELQNEIEELKKNLDKKDKDLANKDKIIARKDKIIEDLRQSGFSKSKYFYVLPSSMA